MQRRDLNAETAPLPAAAYSQAVEVAGGTRMLFISGQLGIEVEGTTPAGMVIVAGLANPAWEMEIEGIAYA